MVHSCSAYNCTNRYQKEGGISISFHNFPKDKSLRDQWLHEMKREKWQPSPKSKLCSLHFSEKCYEKSPWSSQKRLKLDAVPTIFDFPEHLKKKITTRRSPKKRNFADIVQESAAQDTTVSELPAQSATKMSLLEESEETPVKKRKCYVGDYLKDDSLTNSTVPELVDFMKITERTMDKKNKQIRILRQELRRTKEKMKTLESILTELKQKNLASDEESEIIMTSVPEHLHKAFMKKLRGKRTGNYSPSIRSFALSLDFYSPKGYEYVRSIFKNALPHRRTLQKWYQNVKCEPGFSQESIEAIKRKASKSSKPLYGSLMFDEISIRKKVDWDGEKFVGFVDFGNYEMAKNTGIPAKDALVFMVNCLNQRWKIPVGYFFISSMDAVDKANLVNACLRCLADSGIKIISLTFDGLRSNLAMCDQLGASVKDPRHLRPWFYYPDTNETEKVYVFFDPPHALKSVRNTLAKYKIMYDENDDSIEWSNFQKLVEVQDKEGLHLATKIRKRHIRWHQEKMKVKLAAQIMSRSNAVALKYLRLSKYSEDFESTAATESFCLVFNNLFDILNSRNKYGKRFKQGLQKSNEQFIFNELDRTKNYILSLKTMKKPAQEKFIVDTQCKSGFVGFLICIESIKLIYSEYVVSGKLDYILSYKMCQDHLEVFFSAIRSKGGHNNNPSAAVFKAAFKRLLMHATIKNSSGNCVELGQPISILYTSSIIPKYIGDINITYDELQRESAELGALDDERDVIELDHCYSKTLGNLSQYVEDVVAYVAGFVVKQLTPVIQCPKCLAELFGNSDSIPLFYRLKQFESCDPEYGLTKPSEDVIRLCREVEQQYRILGNTLTGKKNAIEYLTLSTLRVLGVSNVFKNLQKEHDEDDGGCHVYGLMKIIIGKYLKIRLHYLSSIINEQMIDDAKGRIRHTLTKQILFQHR